MERNTIMVSTTIITILFHLHEVKCQLGIITDETPLMERGPCISSPCLHNGLCTITGEGFLCACVDGFIGVRCERRSDDCPRDNELPCVFGKCKLDMDGQPRCMCFDGYEGPDCSEPEEGCESKPCLNHGTCVEVGIFYKCVCPEGFLGSHCQIGQGDIKKCISTCDETFEGACWKQQGHNVSVSWGYGDLICNSQQSCFNIPSVSGEEDEEYMEVQMKPIILQTTDHLIFRTDIGQENPMGLSSAFVPHLLAAKSDKSEKEAAFISCNLTHSKPLGSVSPPLQVINVDKSLLKLGPNYFAADVDALYRCTFGLRLNVTMKTHDCEEHPDAVLCSGRGRCFTDVYRKTFQCSCCHGYLGKYCQYEDPCVIKPCVNGGTCHIMDYGGGDVKHYCTCTPEFTGDTCDEIADPCINNECQHEATCVRDLSSYYCRCRQGFSGTYCELAEKCAHVICQNGGTCLPVLDSFFCKCPNGFVGALCEVNINECEGYPCIGGSCIDLVNNYTCSCKPGIEGARCEKILEQCNDNDSQQCENGMCVIESGEKYCSCGIGYTGLFCEIKIDLCANPTFCIAENTLQCNDFGDNVSCSCVNGWTGLNCAINVNECRHNKCQNDGMCVDKNNDFQCICRDNYSGEFCEEIKDKSVADIEMQFTLVGHHTCNENVNDVEINVLQSYLVNLFESSCNCSFSVNDIRPRSQRVLCSGLETGVFMTDLKFEYKKQIQHDLCHLASARPLVTNASLRIMHVMGIKINNELCRTDISLQEVTEESITEILSILGIILGVLLVMLSLFGVSFKVRNMRRKVGASETPNTRQQVSMDNTIYATKSEASFKFDEKNFKFGETSFKFGETSFMSNDLPKWPPGCGRSSNLIERNKMRTSKRQSF